MKGDAQNPRTSGNAAALESGLDQVRMYMADAMARTPLARLPDGIPECLEGGKMLRSLLVLRLAPACGASIDSACRAAAAVEMVHAASLLHDDVIDGGYLRRAAPSFWVQYGAQAAILVGDLLLCEASRLLEAPGESRRLRELIARTGEVCRAEVEQELLLRGQTADWDTAIRLARQKTGALFAFSAVAACRTDAAFDAMRDALREAGYRAGTAYQLSDDVLDATGDRDDADKTLRLDDARKKVTAFGAADLDFVRNVVADLGSESEAVLAPYPSVSRAWNDYWAADLGPALARHLPAAIA